MWLIIFKFITANLGILKGVFGMVSKLPMNYIKTGVIWAVIASVSIGVFNYRHLISENKSLVGQVATAITEYNSCIANKDELVANVDRQNKAILSYKSELEVRGHLIESTKLRNAELLSTLATRLDNLYAGENLKSCDDAMNWLVDTAVTR